MRLSPEYQQQDAWRNWEQFLPLLPPLAGARLLDLGCSIGTMAGLLAAQGAEVTAVDSNAELLDVARARALAGVSWREGDLRQMAELNLPAQGFDGIWCSYVAAYLPDLAAHLRAWSALLKPGGWIALLEIDDFFNHRPLAPEQGALLADFVQAAAPHYDFQMGSKLADCLQAAGFERIRVQFVEDPEFTGSGPVSGQILDGWRRRLGRMRGLQQFCGEAFAGVEAGLLAALADSEHQSGCRVIFAQALKAV